MTHVRITTPRGPIGGRFLIDNHDIADAVKSFEVTWPGEEPHTLDGEPAGLGPAQITVTIDADQLDVDAPRAVLDVLHAVAASVGADNDEDVAT